MSHAEATLPREHLDAKRIAATSGAIAVHLAVLMMLMMPAAMPSQVEEETTTVVSFKDPPKPQPKPIPIERPKPVPIQPQEQKRAEPVRQEVLANVEDDSSALDTKFEGDPPPPTDFREGSVGTEPSMQTLAVLVGPAPPYPRPAIARHLEGTVLLRIHVDASGKPIEVLVEQSSGSRILDEAAAAFVRKRWSFVPAQQGGQAVEAWGLLPVEFALQ